MCGRYALTSPPAVIAERFHLLWAPEIDAHYNIAPSQMIPVVRETGEGREPALLKWGLIPWWAKDAHIGAKLVNARAESLADKPAFRDAYRHRRCLVPADAFYEWKPVAGRKQPYCIRMRDEAPFGMAGLWERWRDPATDETLESCCIVTTAPSQAVAHVHDRMPVIVPPARYAEWLDPGSTDTARLAALLAPCELPGLWARPVSRRVNDARNQGAALVEPVGTSDDAA